MRILLLIVLGFALVAVTVAPATKKKPKNEDGPTENDKKNETDTSSNLETGASTDEENDNLKSEKETSSKPAKKRTNEGSAKKAKAAPSSPSKSKIVADSTSAKKQIEKDLGIEEDIADILKDDEDDTDDQIEIPTPDQLSTSFVDPINLARKIKKVADPSEKKKLVAKLKKASSQNRNSPTGKFYQAAYAALLDENRAVDFWNKQLNKMAETGAIISDAIANAGKLAEADPVGMLLRRGESGALGTLSEGAKGLGKVTDLVYDGVGNLSRLVRAVTFPVDSIPIVKDIKNNVHNFIEDSAKRGKYLSGSFADTASAALKNAAVDAEDQANKREQLFRQFTSSRRNRVL